MIGSPKLLLPLAGLLVACAAAGLIAQFSRDVHAFIAVLLLQGAVSTAAAAIIARRPDRWQALRLVLGTAILLRPIAVAAPAFIGLCGFAIFGCIDLFRRFALAARFGKHAGRVPRVGTC